MWLEGVPVATIKKNDRTETDVVLHWVDGDTGSGFFFSTARVFGLRLRSGSVEVQ